MSNEIAPFGGGKVALMDDKALLEQMQEDADFGARSGDVSYMSFSGKKGRYEIGVDKRAPDDDEPFLVAVPLFKTGYICWRGGKPISKRMAGMREPKIVQPDPDELGPFDRDGDGWFAARSIGARSLANGEEIEFTINSKSGVAVMADLHRDILERLSAGEDPWPVVTFSMEEFEAKGYKNYKPIINVVKWLPTEEITRWTDDDFDPMGEWMSSEAEKVEATPAPRRRRNL
jgi:hypothetical protein